MKIGFIGLGKMGSTMTVRLLHAGHQVVIYDINTHAVNSLAQQGADEGRLTVLEAFDLNLSAPVITAVHEYRLRSRQESPSPDKLLAALR